MKNINQKNENDLDQIEEKLRDEEARSKKLPMPISGKSVFEIKKIKDKGIDKSK